LFVLIYFALTLFTSATLLFFVQPMIGKMVLPRLGGTPAVWNTCMVFFQAVLLLGYGYTHFVSTRLPKRAQLIVQALLLLMPFTVLPFSLGEWTPPDDSNPIFSVLGILAIVVGAPFFVVSTSAPLLQKWFAFTGHPSSGDPYFLYGASNLGSMLALILYPLALEPNFSLEPQTWIWTWAYGFFVLMVLGCIALVWSKTAPPLQLATPPLPTQPVVSGETSVIPAARVQRPRMFSPKMETSPRSEAIGWPRRLRWIALAAVPSSLMLGCTTYMTTDIAAIPFFWVLPLALYLMTFILVFSRWPVPWTESPVGPATPAQKQMGVLILGAAGLLILAGIFMHYFVAGYHDPLEFGLPHVLYFFAFFLFFVFWVVSGTGGPHDFVLYFQPCFLLFLVLKLVSHIAMPTWLEFSLHVVSFFFVTLMCHGELAADRPDAEHLTEFYLCMSVGGVLGGLFNAFVAPMIFWIGVLEYPVAMVLSCFLRPNLTTETTLFPGDSKKGEPTLLGHILDLLLPIGLGLLAYACIHFGAKFSASAMNVMTAVPIVCVLALAMRPLRFGLALAIVWAVFAYEDRKTYNYVFQDRGFFGLVKVRQGVDGETRQKYNTLIHGGIDHGRQHVDPALHHIPCAYFHPLTGIGQVFMKMSWPNTPLPPTLDEFNTVPNPYHSFTLPSWRFPTSLVGLGGDPLSALVTMHSEPPFAVVGLGTGTLAAFAKPYQRVDMYEIDPLVLKLSQGEAPPFTYLQDAEKRGANLKVILGDGRLKIAKAPERWYHVICLDAFSSDAIPVHLLTTDAIEIYLQKLAPGGVLVFNATNRYVDIAGVLKDSADHLGLEALSLSDWYREAVPEKYGTDFVMLRRKPETIAKLNTTFSGGPALDKRLDVENWKSFMGSMAAEYRRQGTPNMEWQPWKVPENHGGPPWTDKYSNLLGVLRIGR
jgi:SAM-dependent methyltransferase